MLMLLSLRYTARKGTLPTGLNESRHFTAHGGLAQLVTTQAKLTIYAMRTTCNLAAVALAGWCRISWKLLQRHLRIPFILGCSIWVTNNSTQRLTLLAIFFN